VTDALTLTALTGIPRIQAGDDLVAISAAALHRSDITVQDGDALVVTSKIVSKSEGRYVRLSEITPGEQARELAAITGKDARMVELVLHESIGVSRAAPNVLVVRHKLGFVSANAGIDQSNVDGDDEIALLLPVDPDGSAVRIREGLKMLTGADMGIVISDSHGRPFRYGNIGVAIGVAGLPGLLDLRGKPDMFGRVLKISMTGYADMVASAAALLTGEGAEGLPVVHVRGLKYPPIDGRAADLVRPIEQDLYRS
jgi:coenzyme F420-0:L-glutamate ligase/coenzyme F420-1:gamma-L-glutamate ligase